MQYGDTIDSEDAMEIYEISFPELKQIFCDGVRLELLTF